jgi:molybdopterin converting factor small subunit
MLEEENLFTAALKKIEIHDVIEQIQIEFAGLCNLIISADLKNIREKEELKSIVKKVGGYLNIGLERLSRDNTVPDADHCAVLIRNYPLSNIFKVGYGIALDLKWRAEKWREKSWFENQGLLLGFWGEEWLGLLGGLLIKKPLFFDNYKTGVLYREFVSMEDIRATDKVLNEIMVFDDIFSLMAINPEPVIDRFLTYKNFILTLWARNYLGLSGQIEPLRLNEFQRLFDGLWADKKKPYKIRRSMKESFLSWLSEQTGLTDYEISGKLGHTLENLFSEIENEYGEVSSKDLDPRYINLFLIQKKIERKSDENE